MAFSEKDCVRVRDIYEAMCERSNLVVEDMEFACEFTMGDLIAHCGFELVEARQFMHFLALEKRRHERIGFNNLTESKKLFLMECDYMCKAAGLPEAGHDEVGVSFENTSPGEQAGMIKSNLQSIASKAQSLHDTIGDMDQLPEWVQEKIAVADEMIDTISDYLKYEYSKMRR